MMPVTFRIL